MEEDDFCFVLRCFSKCAVYIPNELRVMANKFKKNETQDIVVCTEILL